MSIADIDREPARYRGAADTISANLLELDGDPNRQLLDTAPLVGATATAWADAKIALSSVWDWFARFTSFLDRAEALRVSPRTRLATGRERELADFLNQASIELPATDVPLRDRGLLQARHAHDHCTADELLALMADAYARAREVTTRVGAAWDELAPRVAAARAALAGAPEGAETTAVERQLDTLADTLVTDPLSVDEHDVGTIEDAVSVLARAAHELQQLRAELGDRITGARADLARVEHDVAVATATYETTRAKIVGDPLAPPPVVDPSLARALDRAADLADAGRWLDAGRELDACRATFQTLTAAAEASATASRVPLVLRDQLRGRLDAYRAKAHGLGLDEDREVADAHERAQSALHVAPADLTAAAELVEEYQRLLSPISEPEARR